MTQKLSTKARFQLHSRNASSLEQKQNYKKAQTEWELAIAYATTVKQREWCSNRAAFCERMVIMPFSRGFVK